ncbi:MAG: hypothetical protein Q8Q09_11095 [Deltaproteobacteria bacterium]|nr:hypothetical protein [Deltaproteobacteria bacterium]
MSLDYRGEEIPGTRVDGGVTNHRHWWARRERPNAADVRVAKKRCKASFAGMASYRLLVQTGHVGDTTALSAA